MVMTMMMMSIAGCVSDDDDNVRHWLYVSDDNGDDHWLCVDDDDDDDV